MRFVRLLHSAWEVLALASFRGETFWETLEKDRSPPARRMRNLIRYVAVHGPPRNIHQSAPLRDGIFELKTGAKKGPKLRVFYFYDRDRVIVCTHSVWKREAVPDEIDKAVEAKRRYFAAKKRDRLTITDRSNRL